VYLSAYRPAARLRGRLMPSGGAMGPNFNGPRFYYLSGHFNKNLFESDCLNFPQHTTYKISRQKDDLFSKKKITFSLGAAGPAARRRGRRRAPGPRPGPGMPRQKLTIRTLVLE